MKKWNWKGHENITPKWLKGVVQCSLRTEQRYRGDVEEKSRILREGSCFEKACKEQTGVALRDQQTLKEAPRTKRELGVPITTVWVVGYFNHSEVSETKGPWSTNKLYTVQSRVSCQKSDYKQ